MVLGPAQIAEVDGEASDGDHGGADSHQQDEDVGRGVHSVVLLSSSLGEHCTVSIVYCAIVGAYSCSLLRLLGGPGVGGVGSGQSPHHQLPLVRHQHQEPAQPGRVQHAEQTGAGEAASPCYVEAGQQDALTTMFSAQKMLLFNFQKDFQDILPHS